MPLAEMVWRLHDRGVSKAAAHRTGWTPARRAQIDRDGAIIGLYDTYDDDAETVRGIEAAGVPQRRHQRRRGQRRHSWRRTARCGLAGRSEAYRDAGWNPLDEKAVPFTTSALQRERTLRPLRTDYRKVAASSPSPE